MLKLFQPQLLALFINLLGCLSHFQKRNNLNTSIPCLYLEHIRIFQK
jgi:hypothetical protein